MRWPVCLAIISVLAYSGFWLGREREVTPRQVSATTVLALPPPTSAAVPTATPAPRASIAPTASWRARAPSVTELRELLATDPEQALFLAQQANALTPNDAEAAERAWVAVRALDDLKRFHEAQAEARRLLARYPGTHWAQDVERHTLVYPLDQPSREEQQAAMKHD